MDSVTQWFNDLYNATVAYMETGFYRINAVQGLLIAMVAAYLMPTWGRVFVMALGAMIAHLVLDVMLPVLANNAAFRLPPLMDSEYWRYALALYVGYLLVITVFFVIKRMMVGGHHA